MLRAVMSRRQLAEVLVDFWMNHFNVAAGSSQRTKYDISPYDRIALRPHVLGTTSRRCWSPTPSRRRWATTSTTGGTGSSALNENYSREVLELHTVSVTGPYTETDVVELARCLTGWQENYTNAVDGFAVSTTSSTTRAPKTVMGVSIPANGGMQDGLTMIDFLAHHPEHGAVHQPQADRPLRLRDARRSDSSTRPPACSSVPAATCGPCVESIVMSPEFLTSRSTASQGEAPAASSSPALPRARAPTRRSFNTNNLRNRVAELGEDLYEAGPPTGYPDVSALLDLAGHGHEAVSTKPRR